MTWVDSYAYIMAKHKVSVSRESIASSALTEFKWQFQDNSKEFPSLPSNYLPKSNSNDVSGSWKMYLKLNYVFEIVMKMFHC